MIKLGDIFVDASVSESHESDSDVSEYEVEKGAARTDHVKPRPSVVTVEGIVSDTPISDEMRTIRANASSNADGSATLPSDQVLDRLERMKQGAELVEITTARKHYRDMILKTLTVPVSKDTFGSLRFTAVFRQYVEVENTRTQIIVAVPAASREKNLGDRSKDQSLLRAVRCIERSKKTGLCIHDELVSKGADGKWHHPTGEPLTNEELQQWSEDQAFVRDHAAVWDPNQETWADSRSGQPITRYPDRAYWDKAGKPVRSGETTDSFWDNVERGNDIHNKNKRFGEK